jgi:hypothetical protein
MTVVEGECMGMVEGVASLVGAATRGNRHPLDPLDAMLVDVLISDSTGGAGAVAFHVLRGAAVDRLARPLPAVLAA